MTANFDLISDLHVETWDNFDWTGQATAPYCIVAGDVARDRTRLVEVLTHLGQCYAGVFYIDGNDEHRYHLSNLGESYEQLVAQIKDIHRVIYMQDNVVIINGVAILATNGWWTYDFDPTVDIDQTIEWYRNYVGISVGQAHDITSIAYHDAAYLMNSVKKLQTHPDVNSIIIVSHTLPAPWLVEHDPELVDTWRYNCMGNRHLQLVLNEDTEYKIKTWCFGHYHRPADQHHGGIHYVSNPRGRGDTDWCQPAYYPKRIEIKN